MSGLTDDPSDPRLTRGPDEGPVEQAEVYLVLSEAERAQGFQRPLRSAYVHVGFGSTPGCGSVTRMALPIAETYARNPHFYGATYCVGCRQHLPVTQFVWTAVAADGTNERVGS